MDAGEYTLTEKTSPKGYTASTEPVKFSIGAKLGGGLTSVQTTKDEVTVTYSTLDTLGASARVQNKAK